MKKQYHKVPKTSTSDPFPVTRRLEPRSAPPAPAGGSEARAGAHGATGAAGGGGAAGATGTVGDGNLKLEFHAMGIAN